MPESLAGDHFLVKYFSLSSRFGIEEGRLARRPDVAAASGDLLGVVPKAEPPGLDVENAFDRRPARPGTMHPRPEPAVIAAPSPDPLDRVQDLLRAQRKRTVQ